MDKKILVRDSDYIAENLIQNATTSTDGFMSSVDKSKVDIAEITTNKATDFSVVNDTKYPTTEAVEERIAQEKKYDATIYLDGYMSHLDKLKLDDTPENIKDLPIGSIVIFGGTTAPDGWMLCDGQEISRYKYADLYSVIGTTWGIGDNSTTFNLPPQFATFTLTGQTETDFGTMEYRVIPKIIKYEGNNITNNINMRVEWDTSAVTILDTITETLGYNDVDSIIGGTWDTTATTDLEVL